MPQILTDTTLTKKKVPQGQYKWIGDAVCPGLQVRISTTQAKARNIVFYYRYRHRTTKKLIPVRLGCYPGISIDRARRLIKHELRNKADLGQDLRMYLDSKIKDNASTEAKLIKNLVHKFVDHLHRRGRAASTITTYSRYLRAIVHYWGDKTPDEITRGDAEDLFDIVKDNGVPQVDLEGKPIARKGHSKRKGGHRAAGHLLSSGQAFFKWCLDREFVSSNPWAGREKLREESKPNIATRVLSDSEIVLALTNANQLPARDRIALNLLLTTGLRPIEACAAEWKEIDLDTGKWTIPKLRMKYKKADHTVFLVGQILDSLRTWRKSSRGRHRYVFPTMGVKYQHLTIDHLGNAFDKLGIEGFTPKVCRATVRTGLQKLGCPEEIRSRISHHQRGDRVARSYDHHSFDEEAAKWWKIWSEHLSELFSSS